MTDDLTPAEAGLPREGLGRRSVLTGVAAAGVGIPLLAACGSDSSGSDTSASGSSDSSAAPSSPAGSGSAGGGGGDALASTSDVPVGEGVFLDDPNVVITQPTEGDFHAFSRTCTHQGCPVTDMINGDIHCGCHGSLFSATDGSVVEGPANQPLTAVAITVEGDRIVRA